MPERVRKPGGHGATPGRCGGVLACAVVFLVGCGASDQDIFKRAEDHYARKEYAEALKYYRLLSDEHSDSKWADRALERQAVIFSGSLDKPEEAVRLYQRLVSQFPESHLAPGAQLKIGELSYRKLQRYEEAVVAYNRALSDFGADPSLAARVRLAMGKMDYQEGKWEAVQHLTAVLRDHGTDKARCAEAQFYIARALENVKRDPAKSVAEYQKVIDKYPDTRWADDAKKAIGWIYYYTDRTQPKKEEATRKVLVAIRRAPASDKTSFQTPSFIASVGDCLRSLNVEASPSYLMGISGLAFQVYYDRNDRLGGADHLSQNPLSAICKALGLKAEQRQATAFQDGFESLKKALEAQQPAFVPLVLPPPAWVTVAGYDEREKTVAIVEADGRNRSLSWGDLAKRWSTRACPSLDPMNGHGARYTWYGFRKSGAAQSPAKTVEHAMLVGTRLMNDSSSGTFAAGFRAYEELLDDLRTPRDYAGTATGDREEFLRWAAACLPRLVAARQAAASFLRLGATRLPQAKRAHAAAAAAEYDHVVAALRRVSLGVPRATSVTADGDTETNSFQRDCDSSASALEEAAAAERGAVKEMEKACR